MVLLRSLSLDESQGGPTLLPDDAALAAAGMEGLQVDGKEEARPETRTEELEEEEDTYSYLPDAVVKLIQQHLISGESPGLATLHAVLMSSVCRQWRQLASELTSGTAIALDGFDNLFSQNPTVQKFRRLTQLQKEQVFYGAAKLLSGYTDITMTGDGISDRVLQEVALKAGPKVTRVRVAGSSVVTDAGLVALLAQSKSLETLELEDLSKTITGKFLTMVFENCERLTTLHLANMPNLNWSHCKMNAEKWSDKPLTKLHVRGVNLDPDFGAILARLPNLRELELDGPARNVNNASKSCPHLHRVSYQMYSRPMLDEALHALQDLQELRQLELIVKNFTLCADQLRIIGSLPLTELRLDSFIYKQQPTLSRSSYSHVDNEGVKALVDAICNRWCSTSNEMRPLKLSLCGATALTHDAVSALLRLPILTELDIGGCCRIIAMDKMRLVAKVRAGREMLESGRRPGLRSTRFPGLML